MSRRTADASKAVREAWEKEQKLVLEGKGTRDWTPEQQQSIIETAKAYDDSGIAFHGHHMKSVEAHPEYQGDADNIQFLTIAEHKDAHGGSFRNPTNGYYEPSTGITRDFGNSSPIPCEIKNLRNPIIRSEKFKAIRQNATNENREFRRETMSDLDNKRISEDSAPSKMQWISRECQRKEGVTGTNLGNMEASLSHAVFLINEWDRLQMMIAQFQQEMINLKYGIQQIGSTLANNPQQNTALQKMNQYQARLYMIMDQEQDATIKMGTVGEELSESRKNLKDSISNIEPDYLENKELRAAIAEYRNEAVNAASKAQTISMFSYGSSFAKVVAVAKDQITALDSYNERVTELMRRTVELVKSSSSCIEEINGRIGDEDDSQYSIGEKTLHR